MAQCFKTDSRYQELSAYLSSQGLKQEYIDDYLTRKGIVTNGEYCSEQQALSEITKLTGGKSMREAAEESKKQNYLDHKIGNPVDVVYGVGTNNDDITGQNLNENINFQKKPIRESLLSGRELYSSELALIAHSSNIELHSKNRRDIVRQEIEQISSQYGVEFTNIPESEVWEMDRWRCNDGRFIDFIHFYSQSGVFHGTPAKWENFKKLYTKDDSVDARYMEDQFDAEMNVRADFYNAITPKYNAPSELMSIFADPRKMETAELTSEQREILNSIEREYHIERTMYPTLSDIVYGDISASIDDLKSPNETKEIAVAFISQLSENLGIEYEIIDEQTAKDLLASKGINYNPSVHTAFFVDGKTYFIEGRIDSTTAMHEFSHPLLRAIRNENSILFNNMFNSLQNTSAWASIREKLRADYPELSENDDLYKEEALVYAMEFAHENKFQNDNFFKKCIDKIIYAIKQYLRNHLGQGIKISDLSVDTTIGDLATMLENNVKFDIKIKNLTEKDVVSFKKEETELAEEIQKIFNKNNSTLDHNLENFSSSVSNFADALDAHMDYLKNNKELERLKELQTNVFGSGQLDQMIKEMKTANGEKEFVTLSDVEIFKNRSLAFANSLAQITAITSQIKADVEEIKRNDATYDNINIIYKYYNLIDYWQEFLKNFNNDLSNAASENNFNPTLLYSIIGQAQVELQSARNAIENIYLNVATDVIYDELSPMYDGFKKELKENVERLKSEGAPQKFIDDEYIKFRGLNEAETKEYDQLLEYLEFGSLSPANKARLDYLMKKSIEKKFMGKTVQRNTILRTKTEIREMIKGNLGDARFLNSKLEGLMFSTDPILGGMAQHLKRDIVRAKNQMQQDFNDFHAKIQPLIDKTGIDKAKIGSLGKTLGFRDKVLSYDENGNPIESEEWVFLNEFKDYRYERDLLELEVATKKDTYTTSNTEENRLAYLEAKQRLDDFNYKYMNQEYVHEFYEVRNILQRTEAGKKALARMDELNEKIEKKQHFFDFDSEISESTYDVRQVIINEIESLRRELRQLSSTIDHNGQPKTGEDLEIAKVLQEYYEKSGKFYETITDNESFDADYIAFRQRLIDAGYSEGSESFNKEMDLWLRRVMKYGTTTEFDELRRQALERIIELSGNENSDKWKQIFAIANGSKDSDGHINSSLITSEQKQKMREIEMSMNRDEGMSEELKEAIEEYNNLVEKIPTKYYMDSLTEVLNDCNVTSADLNSIFGVDTIEDLVEEFTTPGFDVEKLKTLKCSSDTSRTMYDWFMENHFLSRTINTKGGTINKYQRFYFNNVVKPTEEQYEQSYTVINPETGNVIAVLKGVPAGRYSKRIVKQQYHTEKIVGKTVDNKGGWLPKNREELAKVKELSDNPNDDNYRYKFINTDYERMRTENPDMFALLEAFKEEHLKNQEFASKRNRLYLSFPRYVKNSAETLGQSTTVGIMETIKQYITRLKQFFVGSPDDYEEGDGNFSLEYQKACLLEKEFDAIPVGGLYNVSADDCSTNIQNTIFRYGEDCRREAEMRKNASFFQALEVSLDKNKLKKDTYDASKLKSTGIFERLVKKGDYNRLDAVTNFKKTHYQGEKVKGFGSNSPFLMRIANFLMGRASFSFFAWNLPSALKNSHGIKFQAVIESAAKQHMDIVSLEKGNLWSLDAMAEIAVKGNYDEHHPKSLKRKIIEQFDFKQDKASKIMTDPLWRSVTTDVLDGKFFTAPREWLEDQATYQLGAGILIFKKINVGGKMMSYMDAIEDRDGVLTLKEGADIRYLFHDTEYIPQTGDTFESIAKKFNISDPEGDGAHYIQRMAKNLDEKIANVNKAKRDYDNEVSIARRSLTGNELEDALASAKKDYDAVLEKNKIVFKNDMYHKVKNEIDDTNNGIGGAYADFDQPEWHKYFLYRTTFFLRRYFIPMFMKRFRFNESISPGSARQARGYYIQTLDLAHKIIASKGKYLHFMSTNESAAFMRTVTEMALLACIPFISRFLFGYDPDDEERYKKLRKISGAAPFPFVENDNGRKFDMGGFLELHALHLLLQIQNENDQFMPGFGGIKEMTKVVTDTKSVMVGPTVENLELVFEDLINMALADDTEGRGYYTRDVGPYKWQKKESPKVYNHMMKWFAITGTTVDPAMAIQNLESQRAKVRR